MKPCAFCAIVRGETEQSDEVVYADGVAVAFMCVPPATAGHVLVVSREHRRDIWEIREDEAAALMSATMRVAHAIRQALAPAGLNLRHNSGARAGQDVLHFHLHLVPRYENDTVLPGGVWGVPPWQPPPGGAAERRRLAALVRAELGPDSNDR